MSQSTASSIHFWLDGQPDQPHNYALAHSQTSNRKEKRQRHNQAQPFSQYFHLRGQLMEVSGNGLRSGEQSLDRKPPFAEPITGISHDFLEEDLEETTMSRSELEKTPSLQARPQNLQLEYPSQEESLDNRESRNSKLSSRSPTRRLGDFQFSDMPVDSRAWAKDAIPEELKDLVKDMEHISVGIGVVPTAVKDRFVGVGQTVHDFQLAKGETNHRGKEMEIATGGSGHTLFWHRASMIEKATMECMVEGYSESAWNSEVYSSILRLALEGLWEAEEVWYADITSARTLNKSPVPWNVATGAVQSKMVDYAIVIRPSQNFKGDVSQSLHQRIIEKLRTEGGESINHTAAEHVRFKPIGATIATKEDAVDEDETHVQLATWLTAQYCRLRQLVSKQPKTKLPSFPVLSVQGHRWLLMIACIHENNRIDLVKELDLGSTRSMVGVYQVIAAIRRIARWVRDEYRPWFEKEVLGMASAV